MRIYAESDFYILVAHEVDAGCDGTAKNTITVTNVLKGGSGEIGAGANRSFVSDIAGASGGSIECEMKKEEHSLIDFSSTTEKNTLHVDSQIGKNYSGFVFSQNEFPRDRILCDGKADGGADVRYTKTSANAVTAPGGQQNNPKRSSSS